MRVLVLLAAAAGLLSGSPAWAKVRIAVDLDAQTMHVESKGGSYDWKVSSGKPGYETPAGSFKVLWMDKEHHSDTYENAYMPNAIFFAPGYAIHGFGKSPWGHKASHGCIRLPAAKAAMLFDLVKAEGAEISITGDTSVVAPTVASVNRRNEQAAAEAPRDPGAENYDVDAYQPRRAPRDYIPAEERTPRVDPGSLFGSFY